MQDLRDLARRLVDQEAAQVIVPAAEAAPGFWFGGGNVTRHPDGSLWLIGRYRNAGDSRLGVSAGTRGWALSLFRSADGGVSWTEEARRTKADLSTDHEVLSIEGAAVRFAADGAVEIVVSTEKAAGYPDEVADHQKPGTGVWTIDRLRADSATEIGDAGVEPLLASDDPSALHVKDPFWWPGPDGDRLGFCHHPFSWSSSNTGRCDLRGGDVDWDVMPRGRTWDVAITRVTAVVDVGDERLVFYDGGESLRDLDEHAAAVTRPRGYSCEELGGVAVQTDEGIERLSVLAPEFVSPWGTGSSRYVDVVRLDDGWLATWQQSRPDGSQPLVAHHVAD